MAARLAALVAATALHLASATVSGTVNFVNDKFVYIPGQKDPNGVAFGSFSTMDESTTGFGQLTIQVNTLGAFNDRRVGAWSM